MTKTATLSAESMILIQQEIEINALAQRSCASQRRLRNGRRAFGFDVGFDQPEEARQV